MQRNPDEIDRHLQGRYIGPTEAAWRIFSFKMHEEYPPVIPLPVHLPGDQPVYFAEDMTSQEVRNRMEAARSKLMAFFHYNATFPDRPRP